MNLRYPNITASDPVTQMVQLRAWLHQLVDQLNMAEKSTETVSRNVRNASVNSATSAVSGTSVPIQTPLGVFNTLKPLIIKSADVVNAYYEEINKKLVGIYAASSDFGDFIEQTEQKFTATGEKLESVFSNVQTLLSKVSGIDSAIAKVDAHIKAGKLYDVEGVPVYGLEIGQRTEINGQQVFNKYAQFTADKLSFFDQNGIEVAYISDNMLYITTVNIQYSLIMGGFVDEVRSDNSIVCRWIG